MIVAIYARKSTEQHGVSQEGKSVTRQIDRARDFAADRGWVVADEHIYVDEGISGAEFEAREGLMRLLSALTPTPPFNVLIVMNTDRLGREQYESAYTLKRLVQAGVRVFEYLDGRECLLDTPIAKLVEMIGCYRAEEERYQASQRTRDALARKAEQGYVTGGTVFGYDNIAIVSDSGTRDHVERRIDPEAAATVHRIFELLAEGLGFKRVAKTFNAEAVAAPRPRRAGRPQAWTPSSVRAIAFNPLYTGRIVWGRTRKRDSWGRKKQRRRHEGEWLKLSPREELRIVSDEVWQTAHDRIAKTRETYRAAGRLTGRPPGGAESKYLLTGFAECAGCRGSMVVGSRASGRRRKTAYVCANHRERGNTVCDNRLHAGMEEADRAVLSAVEHDLLRPEVVEAALEDAIRELQPSVSQAARRREKLQEELRQLDAELARYAEAIATAAELDEILAAMKGRQARKAFLNAELAILDRRGTLATLDGARLQASLHERLTDWQGLLQRQPAETRQILRRLLVGRLVFTPKQDETGRYYEFAGQGSISELISGVVLPKGWWPQRDSNPCFSLERAVSWASRRWGRPTALPRRREWLGEEDSNPRYVVQSHASYH
jgi:site-specific DNA recombinase